jgi:hypothetical protein
LRVHSVGWVLLIEERFEQARVLVALLVSVAFLALSFVVVPLVRVEDHLLTMIIEMALIVIYVSILLIKSCDVTLTRIAEVSPGNTELIIRSVCSTYGFGETADGGMRLLNSNWAELACSRDASDPVLSECAMRALTPPRPLLHPYRQKGSFCSSSFSVSGCSSCCCWRVLCGSILRATCPRYTSWRAPMPCH